MIKLLLIISMLIMSFPTAVSNKYDEYLSGINEAYDKYTIDVYENENYTLAIVQGICNDTLSYGVFLASYQSGAYVIKLFIDEKEYSLPQDSRKDTMVYAVNMPAKETYVCVYDNLGAISTKRLEVKLDVGSIDDLNDKNTLYHGMNRGVEVSTMARRYNVKKVLVFISAISFFIIVAGVIIIIFLKKNKKGLFNKDNIYQSDIEYFPKEQSKEEKSYNQENDGYEIKEDTNEVKEVYQKKYYFDDDEEEYIDIVPLLEAKGYKTNYKDMSEEEKNEVMIFFMTLRYEGKISEAQYKRETSRLWKKY